MKGFECWDVYYLSEYSKAFMIHGDGEPLLFEYQDGDSHFCYAVMKSDISDCVHFRDRLDKRAWFDLETPYGYGGPLSDKVVPETSQKAFAKEMKEYCNENHIISQFVRFHPLLDNSKTVPLAFETRYMRETIFMDTERQELIMSNMDSKNRNMVRKAIKNGVTVEWHGIEDYEAFLEMYQETMEKNRANQYYFFDRSYFEAQKEISENACIGYAVREGCPIAGAIFYYNERFMHYHLAGSRTDQKMFAPGNLLLYEAALRANSKGIGKLHLGGGLMPDDSLFGFKKQFNKKGRLPFVIGRTVFDKAAYDHLLDIREKADPGFQRDNSRMIQYRYE